jgi:uncharacterized MAPEG superfamily protein
MTPELVSLTWVAALSAIMWIPYTLNTIAVENLVLFAALVLVAHAADISNATTVLVCKVYFWARLVHFVAYTIGIPWVRTLAFVIGWLSCVALLVELL